MNDLIIIKNINDYIETVEQCVEFFNENIEDSIYNTDFLEQKEIALRDDDFTELHSTIIDFIEHYFNIDVELTEKQIREIMNDYAEIGYHDDIAVTIAYKLTEDMEF